MFGASLDFSTQANSRCGARYGRRVNLRSGAPSTEDPQRTPPGVAAPKAPSAPRGQTSRGPGAPGGPPEAGVTSSGTRAALSRPPPGARGDPQRPATPPKPGHAKIMCLFPETKTLAKWESTPRKRDCIEERDFSKAPWPTLLKGLGASFFPGTDRASPPRRDGSLRAEHRVLPVDLARANVRTNVRTIEIHSATGGHAPRHKTGARTTRPQKANTHRPGRPDNHPALHRRWTASNASHQH